MYRLSVRRLFSNTPRFQSHDEIRSYYAQQLTNQGLPLNQVNPLLDATHNAIRTRMEHLASSLTTRADQAETLTRQARALTQLADAASLTDDQQFANVRSAYDRIATDMETLRTRTLQECNQCEASVQLDISLEKKRSHEVHAQLEQRSKDMPAYLAERVASVRQDLQSVSLRAQQMIGGFLLVSFLTFLRHLIYT